MSDTKERIIENASQLFLTQGYQKTTIKQISIATKVPNGSIYHFFKNKYEILKLIIINSFNINKSSVEEYYKDRTINNAYRYCASILCILYIAEKFDNICELAWEFYRSGDGIKDIAAHAAGTNLDWFGCYWPEATVDDYYLRTLAVEGCIYGFLSQNMLKSNIPFRNKMHAFFSVALSAYRVPQEIINETLSEESLTQMIEECEDIIEVCGYTQTYHLE